MRKVAETPATEILFVETVQRHLPVFPILVVIHPIVSFHFHQMVSNETTVHPLHSHRTRSDSNDCTILRNDESIVVVLSDRHIVHPLVYIQIQWFQENRWLEMLPCSISDWTIVPPVPIVSRFVDQFDESTLLTIQLPTPTNKRSITRSSLQPSLQAFLPLLLLNLLDSIPLCNKRPPPTLCVCFVLFLF